jgi:hypothetical protein
LANTTDLLDNGIKQRCQVICERLRGTPSDAIHAAGIDDGDVALFICGAQLAEEVKG